MYIDGYNLLDMTEPRKKGGGVLLYFKQCNNFTVSKCDAPDCNRSHISKHQAIQCKVLHSHVHI